MNNYFFKVKTILIFLYSVQGVFFNFIADSLIFIQKENLSYTEIGIIKLCMYPFSLKFFWAPFIDTYYVKAIGRRKTWIVLMQILLLFSVYHLYLEYDDMIRNKHIYLYTIICTLCLFFIASQDIALDGWALTLCRENCTLASICQTIGHKVGSIQSVLIFLQLNSTEFCNKWIFSEKRETPLISIQDYFLYIIIYVSVATVICIFFPESPDYIDDTKKVGQKVEDHGAINNTEVLGFETKDGYIHTHQEETKEEETLSLKENIKTFFKIVSLSHVRKYYFFVLLFRLSTIFFNEINGLKLIENGFQKERLAVLSIIVIPFELFAASALESKKDNFWIFIKSIFGLRICLYIADLLFVIYYKEIVNAFQLPINIDIIILGVITISSSILDTYIYSCLSGFLMSVCDKSAGATYITTLYSLLNLSYVFPRYFIFQLADFIPHATFGIACLVYSIFSYAYLTNKLLAIEQMGKSSWKIIK